MRALTFYFDFVSPYSFFSWTWVQKFCAERDLVLEPEPVVLGVLLNQHGQLGPAEIPAKREFAFRDCLRCAADLGLPTFELPATHPFNPLPALRVSTKAAAGEEQVRVIDALFNAGWQQGIEMSDPEELARVLTEAGLDGGALMARTADPAVKDALKTSTGRALERGVFGVPTFMVEDELFWGNDQRDHLDAWVMRGERGYDPDALRALLERKVGITRKR